MQTFLHAAYHNEDDIDLYVCLANSLQKQWPIDFLIYKYLEKLLGPIFMWPELEYQMNEEFSFVLLNTSCNLASKSK